MEDSDIFEALEREASEGDAAASVRLAAVKAVAGDWDYAVRCLEAADADAALHLQSVMRENEERRVRAESRRPPARLDKRDAEDRHRERAAAKAAGAEDWELDLVFGAGDADEWEHERVSALAGDAGAALSVSRRLKGQGDLKGAEEVLRSALRNGGQDQWPHRGEAMIGLAALLQDKGELESGLWFRKAASEGSDEAAELAAQWCLTNGLREEGEFRFEVLVKRGQAEMRSAVSYLDSEWKTYRYRWTETDVAMGAWCRAMRREMLHTAAIGNTQEAGLLLSAVSESRDWSPQPEDIVVNALQELVLPPLRDELVRSFWRSAVWGEEPPQAPPRTPREAGFALLDWLTRTLLPAVLDAAGRPDSADLVAALSPIEDRISAEDALSMLRELRANPWENIDVPERPGDWPHRMLRWARADSAVSRSLLSDLAFQSEDSPHSDHVFRLMSGRLLWVRMAHSTGLDAEAWVRLWDESSRVYFTAMRWAAGRVAGVVYDHDPDSMIDPQLAIEAAMSEMKSTLQASLRSRFLLESSGPE